MSEQTNNSGKIDWNIGTNTSLHRYPFGTAAGTYIPFELTLSSGNIGRVTVSTYPTAANNTPYPSSPVAVSNVDDVYGNDNSTNVVDRFWQIDKDGASGTATLTFTAASAEVGTITGLQAQRWDATNGWEAPLAGQSNSTNTATVPGVTTFSPWTLSGNGSPLPISLLNFTATAVDNEYVDLYWETASEINNDYFTIEKTSDGVNFETVMVVDGGGTSSQPLHYIARDDNPFGGISYYRLKQTDFNGGFSYSPFAPVEITAGLVFDMQVFPNPAEEHTRISITGTGNELLSLSVVNALGSLIYEEEIMLKNGKSVFDLETTQTFPPGVYMVIVSGKDIYRSTNLLVK
ncbi:MAG: PKD domain-containing protein [Bacteroidetes bacterium]|nr:MAG: PKD domain-containing protein [Bacteroidota bacterium]